MWRKCKKLGSGSYGTVHLAAADDSFSMSSPSFAAVKSVELENSITLQREAQFLKEFRGNPYIVQGYGEDVSLEENGECFYNLLMEYASGGTLDELIERYEDGMPESHVASYTYMLLKGLSDVHSKGFIHCDIKPANILVFPSQQGLSHLKLADFGLSKHEIENIKKFRGTAYYGAPESLKLGLQGPAADIWSLGCVVLEMMNGQKQIEGEENRSLEIINGRKYIWKEENRFEAEIPEYISVWGKDFLNKCFMDADSRWSAEMLLNHPFIIIGNISQIVSPLRFEFNRTHQTPFGSRWITTEGMFSSSTSAGTKQQCSTKCYQLFTENQSLNTFAAY